MVVGLGCMAIAFRLGRSSAAPNVSPAVAGAAAAPDPKLAALDNRIAQYNINLRQIDQDQQRIREMDQDQQASPGTYDGHQETVIMNEKNALGDSTVALYRQIQSDPAFPTNYRETTYNSTHGFDTAAWGSLRYIERR